MLPAGRMCPCWPCWLSCCTCCLQAVPLLAMLDDLSCCTCCLQAECAPCWPCWLSCCTCCLQAVPLLAMLDDLVPRMGAGQAGTLRKVVFVWLSHTGDEFSIMDPSLLELARQALLHS